MKTTRSYTDWVLFTILTFIWGGAYLLMKKGLVFYSSLEVAAFRVAVGSIVLSPLLIKYGKEVPKKKWPVLIFSGFLGSMIPAILFATAQQSIGSGVAGVLSSFTPVFTFLISVLFFKQELKKRNVYGLVGGVLAAFLLVYESNKGFGYQFSAAGLILVATICYAINLNILKYAFKGLHPLAIASVTLFFPGVLCVVFLQLNGTVQRTLVQNEWDSFYAVVALGAGATGAAIVLFNYLVKTASPLFASSITYTIPVVAILLGFLDGETITLAQGGAVLAIVYCLKLMR